MALRRPLVMLAAVSTALFPYAVSAPTASAAPGDSGPASQPVRTVSYHGVSVEVPADWPVVDLDRDPTACVRLDKEAVYLGEPGEQQDCPAHAIGRADTVWLRDSDVAPSAAPMTSPSSTRLGTMAAKVDSQPLVQATQAELPAQDVAVQTTYAAPTAASKGVVDEVLDSAEPTTAKDTTAAPNPAFHAVTNTVTTAPKTATTAATSGSVRGSVATGMGFDTCAAPSLSTMRAWQRSPYRTLGIYIGGLMRACGDGNLSASWVRQATDMGWGLLPIYVGRQAPCFPSGARITPAYATSQGEASAVDAVNQARRFGIGAGSPIYYDMEGYSTTSPSCSTAVTTFVSAWSAELKRLGYRPAVYGGNSSLMRDLVAKIGSRGFTAPGDVWSANWNYRQDTDTPYIPSNVWDNHQRVHQYHGDHNERWGGVSINIDSNWVDAHVAGRARPQSYGTTTYGPGSSHFVFTGGMNYWRPNAGAGVRGMAYWTHPSGHSWEGNGATWSPSLASGRYRVRAYVPSSYANARVRYTVTHADGHTTKVVDQAKVGGWVTLGTFEDRSGSPLRVHAGDNATQTLSAKSAYIGVDAMRFARLEDAPTAPGAPGGVSAAPGNARATVRWSAAAANGATVDRYTVTASPGGKQVSVSGSARSATVTGLTNWQKYTFTVRAHNSAGTGVASAASRAVTPNDRGHLTPVTPVRIVDTRHGTAVNGRSTALPANGRMTVKVAGVRGSSVPSSATAAALNVMVTRSTRSGHLYVGDASDGSDVLAFGAGETVSHGVATRLRSDGTLRVVNHSAGTVHVLVDVRGYSTPVGDGNYHPVTPVRLARPSGTRSNSAAVGRIGGHRTVKVRVAGVAGSPVPQGAQAVALNVTVGSPSADGYLQVSNTGRSLSALSFRKGVKVANFVLSKVASDGTVTVSNPSRATVNLYVDVQGYLTRSNTGTGWMPTARTAVFNTMAGTRANPRNTAIPARSRTTVHIAGASGTGVPRAARSAALNVTVTRPARGGWLHVGPVDRTGTSTINFRRGETLSNFVVSKLNDNGNVVVTNHASRAVNVRVDVVGYTR